jgi:peptidoglycan/xylan/chitin deacetylase (PgdA/CDA1 family)
MVPGAPGQLRAAGQRNLVLNVNGSMKRAIVLFLLLAPALALADIQPVELHHELSLPAGIQDKVVALTLDACGGAFDARFAQFLIERRIQVTVFATRRWIRRNPQALALLNAHADLFEIEDHGANHVPAIVGADRRVYGLAGAADMKQLRREVTGGAEAVKAATGTAPRWYRGATGEYDPQALKAIEQMGYKVAGFSVNADNGATLSHKQIVARLKKVRSGDIIIAHLNKPDSDTAKGMAAGLQLLMNQGFRFVRLDASSVRPLQKRI